MSLSEVKPTKVRYDGFLESALRDIESSLKGNYLISKRAIGLLLLQGDHEIQNMVKEREAENYIAIEEIIKATQRLHSRSLNFVITMQRQAEADKIVARTFIPPSETRIAFSEHLSRMMMSPLTGIPILLVVLYFGLYQFVGVFGAGTVVNFLEGRIFAKHINPHVNAIVKTLIPWESLRNLFAGEYGIITLGVRYAIAIILPIVGTFFIAFSIIEDTGYLPRLAMLVDRIFKKIGLNGRAVIPIVLGFGCDTMATIVSRTLETKRERVIATLLLALAIPCSAQLGVIFAIMSGRRNALLLWGAIVGLTFLLVGFLSARLMPGEKPSFYMEVPPLRLPNISNILTKTYTRMQWYFFEVFPMFILASVLIWIGKLTGLFDLAVRLLSYPVRFIGLPEEAAVAFLFGFFRRDYGAAGLYDLQTKGLISGTQIVVAGATLTLFVPCIAQFSVMAKERGIKTAITIAAFIFPFAFLSGFMVNSLLTFLRIQL